MESLKDFVDYLNRRVARNRKQLGEFAEQITKDPHHALMWAEKTLNWASEVQVFSRAAQILTDNRDFGYLQAMEELHGYLEGEVLTGALYPPKSSNQIANALKTSDTAAMADLLKEVKQDLTAYRKAMHRRDEQALAGMDEDPEDA